MKSAASILVALCLIHLQDADATVKVLHKSVVTTDKALAFWVESYTDEHQTYALCDKKDPNADEIKCTVIRDKKPYGDDTYLCDVTLKRPHGRDDSFKLPRISVQPFGEKYAALSTWKMDKYLNFTVVQMDNCRVSEAAIYTGSDIDRDSVKVVGHSDSFDVFFNDVALCGDKTCKATIGADGRIINKPQPSIKINAHYDPVFRPIVALDNGPSGNGYFYVAEDGNDNVLVLVKPDGTEKSLARHPKSLGNVAISKKNNLLGLCYQGTDQVDNFECNQYDYDGNLKRHTMITSDHKNHGYLDNYNLPNGGFYLFGIECKREIFGCARNSRHFIERIDADGAKTGKIYFQGFDRTYDYLIMSGIFYENESKEMCYSLAGTLISENGSGRSELTANCFTDADFSK